MLAWSNRCSLSQSTFFARDRLKYDRMNPLYLADMQMLQVTDPEIYEESLEGNWVINKNPRVPF